ncbi:MAG: alpha/beta fold hydrolase [Lachnospiraceae bacterium]|nr:alpha/beta fold hydrolase [Lachnospiraceae bacterium]
MNCILIIIILLVLAVILITVYSYYECFRSPAPTQGNLYRIPNSEQYDPYRQRITKLITDFSQVEYIPIGTVSYDGLKLYGRFYKGREDMPFVIGFHGYRSMAVHDYCGEGPHLIEQGYNLILPDQRACGDSEGHVISFGINERYDCLAWINYVKENFGSDRKIFLSGISMGAATVLMAAGFDLPDNVVGIMADCGFTSPKDILKKVADDRKKPSWIMYPFIRLAAKVFGHFNLEACSAVDTVKKTRVPILIAHGEDDRFVPHYMSTELQEANPLMIKRESYPGAAHAISFMTDEERYKKMTEDFMRECQK